MIKTFEDLKQTSAKCSACLSSKFTGADGKRHIVLCGGTGCLSSRADEITAEFNKLVAEMGLSEKVTVNQVGCFGFCSQGPFVKIYPEDTLYRLVTIEDVAEIMEKDIVGGEIIDRLLYKLDGKTYQRQEEIPFYKKQTRLVLENCGHIEAENIGESFANDGYQALAKALF
ncbi:MAG: NAD(P)H-dependent oxidoreductase subunit E, partial [Clostridia bacterium]|nr:NAD(P)H-dependent oxidoreductase subunit E [Clostridia bacterium]